MNELIDLIQRMDSILDEDKQIYAIRVSGGITSDVQVSKTFFLKQFDTFDITVLEGRYQFPYELSTEIDGVKFLALMSAEDVLDLKDSMPDKFEFIQREIQQERAA